MLPAGNQFPDHYFFQNEFGLINILESRHNIMIKEEDLKCPTET